MKIVRFSAALITLAALMVAVTVCVRQRVQIVNLKESQHRLAAQHQELSANYTALQAIDEARNAEIVRLRGEAAEILKLRNQLAQSKKQLAAAATKNQVPKTENSNDFAGYLTKEQLGFAGFESLESAFQSMRWASMNGDYTNWVAALAPQLQQEELANPRSMEEFQRDSALNARIKGMQVLAKKLLGDDKVELKVRMDSENSVVILVFPMVG